MVGLDHRVDVALVDAEGDAHQHLLRPLRDLAVHLLQVRLLERLEAEVVVLEVAVVDDRAVEPLGVLGDDVADLVGDERRVLPGLRVDVRMQLEHRLRERLARLLVQVRDGDARRQLAVVGVLRRQERGGLGGEVVELERGDAVVHAEDHLLRHDHRVDVRRVEAVAQLLDARGDLVERHRLLAAISLNDQHGE